MIIEKKAGTIALERHTSTPHTPITVKWDLLKLVRNRFGLLGDQKGKNKDWQLDVSTRG